MTEHSGTGEQHEDRETSAHTGLAVRNVTVRYARGRRAEQVRRTPAAVNDVSLEVARHEVVALTGPSGCGKSTLLRAICGLEPLETGSIEWGSEDLTMVPPHKRGFGLMFQDGQLFAHMNVAKNIAYGLRSQGMPRLARESRVTELLELIGLSGFAARPVTELSGGERQRVALARSLAPQPRLLLLDEPLSALDHGLRGRLASDLARLLRETGTTAMLVTHDPDEAAVVADRVIHMRAGELVSP